MAGVTCKQCSTQNLGWAQSRRTGRWYLVERDDQGNRLPHVAHVCGRSLADGLAAAAARHATAPVTAPAPTPTALTPTPTRKRRLRPSLPQLQARQMANADGSLTKYIVRDGEIVWSALYARPNTRRPVAIHGDALVLAELVKAGSARAAAGRSQQS